MSFRLYQVVFLSAVTVILVTGTTNICMPSSYALYKIKFDGLWTKATFPKVYPVSRPKAEWSPVIGRTHSSDYKLFKHDNFISERLKPFAESGESRYLDAEGQGNGLILDAFSTPPLSDGYGVAEATFLASTCHAQVSLAAKITPSPDWFVGLDNISLRINKTWQTSLEFNLWPLDAGTQRGYTFSSPKWRSDPVEKITLITNQFPNHTADAFYYPQWSSLPPIAKVGIQLMFMFQQVDSEKQSLGPQPLQVLEQKEAKVVRKPPVPLLVKTSARSSTDATNTQQSKTMTQHQTLTTSSYGTNAITDIPTTASTVLGSSAIKHITDTVTNELVTNSNNHSNVGLLKVTNSNDDFDTEDDDDESGSGFENSKIKNGRIKASAGHSERKPSVNVTNIIKQSTNRSFADDKQCLVSDWSEWTACSRTCGYGVRTRSRTVLKWTGDVICPELIMDTLCGSMKNCNWNHFSTTFNNSKSIIAQPTKRLIKVGNTKDSGSNNTVTHTDKKDQKE